MTIRDDVREHFEREADRHPVPPGLRATALAEARVRAVEQHPVTRSGRDPHIPLGRRTELAAGIAAIVLAAIVIGAFAYIRLDTRLHTIAPPQCFTAPFCTPLSKALSVSNDTPVILFYDPTNPVRWISPDLPAVYAKRDGSLVDGITWDGQNSGKVTQIPYPDPPQSPSMAAPSNPAGSLFVAFPNILNRSGGVVAKLEGGPAYYDDFGGTHKFGGSSVGIWADDGLHYCQINEIGLLPGGQASSVGRLQLTTPGGTPRDVAQLGDITGGMYVAACSVLADRAVVVQSSPSNTNFPPPGTTLKPLSPSPAQYWVIQLSTGRVLWQRGVTGGVVASRDGMYVAERVDLASPTSTIYGPNGSAMGHLSGSVRGFSWDGSLAVVESVRAQASVVRLVDGTTVWTGPLSQQFEGSQPEPGGTSLAIQTVDFGHPFIDHRTGLTYGFPTVLYVVSADGAVLMKREIGGLLGSP